MSCYNFNGLHGKVPLSPVRNAIQYTADSDFIADNNQPNLVDKIQLSIASVGLEESTDLTAEISDPL
ncbi:MAG: hypothetical protein ACK4M7_07850, partial [Burkholderiales bacterium]